MKKLSIQLLILPLIALMMASCGNVARKQLAKTVEITQKSLPIDLGTIGYFTELNYDEDDNTVTMVYEINESVTLVENIVNGESMQRQFLSSFLVSDSAKEMTDLLVEADASLDIVYRGMTSGKEHTIAFTNEELKAIVDAPAISEEENDRRQIEMTVATENANCPMQIDENTEFTSAELVGDYVEYKFTLSGLGDIDFTDEIIDAMKESNREALSNLWNGTAGNRVKQLYYSQNIGIKYIYTDSETGKSFTITFTPDEIKNM